MTLVQKLGGRGMMGVSLCVFLFFIPFFYFRRRNVGVVIKWTEKCLHGPLARTLNK